MSSDLLCSSNSLRWKEHMGHFSKQAGGCGNERTRRLKATKPCNQFLSSTLAIHLVLQSRLEFPNTLTGESQPLHPMHTPNPRCYGQHLARNTLPALTYSKTKETRENFTSPSLFAFQ